ncbi:MAG: hypothetical protein IJM26_05290 [Lachnospiraceae bacterium]|nr:hypothetical protein [Lachnospiraceae bacterium]MBR0153182.1 hypothetical protein [Lachnospiraceae bacterium]
MKKGESVRRCRVVLAVLLACVLAAGGCGRREKERPVEAVTAEVSSGEMSTEEKSSEESSSEEESSGEVPSGETSSEESSGEASLEKISSAAVPEEPDAERSFYRSVMSAEELAIYDAYLEALHVRDFDGDLVFERDCESQEEHDRYWRILHCVEEEHPEFIFEWSDYDDTQEDIRLCIPDSEGNRKRAEWLAQIDEKADGILRAMPENLSKYEKYLYLAKAVCDMTDYSFDGEYAWSMIGVFLEGKAVCQGYADAFAYLCEKAGLMCLQINAGEHSWNLIRLDGEYYYMDPTWMDTDPAYARAFSYADIDEEHKEWLEASAWWYEEHADGRASVKDTGSAVWDAR